MNNLKSKSGNDNRVLYLSYDGLTDPLGRSQVLPYLKGLSNKGFEIHIISFEKKEKFVQGKKEIEKEIHDNSGLLWFPLSYTSKPPVFSTIYDIFRLRQKAKHLHTKYNYKIIHARSYITALVALAMKKKYNTKFLFDMRGFWADERIDGNIWTLSNPVYKIIYSFFKKKERQFFQNADYNISLTQTGVDTIHNWEEMQNIPFSVIPCCADEILFNCKRFSNEDKIRVREELGISSNTLVLSYLGSIGTWYMLKEMLDFFKVFKKHFTQAKFLFITNEPARMILTEASKTSVNPEDIIIRSSARSQVPDFLYASDITVFFIKPSFSKKASSPTKLAEALGMGLPVIANSNVGDVEKILNENKLGYVIENFNDEEYNDIIQKIDSILKIPRQYFSEKSQTLFGLQSGISKYEEVYRKLFNGLK